MRAAAAWPSSASPPRLRSPAHPLPSPTPHTGCRCIVEGQGVGLLHGSITHLLDGYSGGQIVTNDGVGRGLRHPGQPGRPGQPVRRVPARDSAAAGSAGRRRTPAARRRGCRRPAPGPRSRPPWWWRPRRPAARARHCDPLASTVVTDVCPRSSTTAVLPCATRASTRAKILSCAPTAVVGAQRVDRTVGAAEHELAVGAAGDRGELGRPAGRRRPPGSPAAGGDIEPEVAAPRRRGTTRAVVTAGQRRRRTGQRDRPVAVPTAKRSSGPTARRNRG